MANTNEKLKKLKEIHQQEEALYSERNEKYGDSFAKTFKEYGKSVALIRLEDKLNRAKNLISGGLEGSDGESLIDTLKDLSNYANMTIIELMLNPEVKDEVAQEAPQKKRKKAKGGAAPTTKTETTEEKGPLDDLTKKQLIEVISQLGGTVPKKANREKLISMINGFPKAKVAVAITSLKAPVESLKGETEIGGEE